MNIETRDFGTIEAEQQDIITFVEPILGFEELCSYVILFDQAQCPEFAWLQSVDSKDACFILADPRILGEKYTPQLPRDITKDLGEGELMLWLIAVVYEDFGKSTVNLKSPIVLNPATRKASQVVLEQKYPICQKII